MLKKAYFEILISKSDICQPIFQALLELAYNFNI